MQNYIQEDSMLIEKIVYEVKSQGIFDQFRKECIADVDTKPAYQNLRQRVEGSVNGFLNKQKWNPDMNKNQVREMLRKNIYESGFLETGVERIVDQVVNPKINSVFLPKVSELVYKFFGIQKPSSGDKKTESQSSQSQSEVTLLPTDLEAVSPESDKHSEPDNADDQTMDDSKIDEDESPPFEPLEEQVSLVLPEETSIDSHMSGFSGLVSHDSNGHDVPKPSVIETSNQDSVTSKQSSDRLSIVMSDDNDTKMEVDEPKIDNNGKSKDDKKSKDEKSKDEKYRDEKSKDERSRDERNKDEKTKDDKSRDEKGKDEKSHRSRHESKSDKKDRDRKDSKDKYSKDRDKSRDRDRKDSTSRNGKSDKEKDKSKSHSSSSHRHSSSSTHRSHKESSSSKDRDKSKSKSSSSSSKDVSKESSKESKDKYKDDKKKDSKRHHSSSSSSDKHKKDNHKSSSSSRSKDKKDSKSKDRKDCESDTKKRTERRSTDRDSNDGHSSLKSSTSSFESFSSTTQSSQQGKKSSNTTNSGDSGNSDAVEKVSSAVNLVYQELSISTGQIKLYKPKFASNIHEARRLMKIRKKLAKIENERNARQLDLLPSVNVSAASWDALEAKLNETIAKESNFHDDDSQSDSGGKNDDVYYLKNDESPKRKRYKEFLNGVIVQLEKELEKPKILHENRKRKMDIQSDIKNNNKKFNIEVHENFSLPLSPAESDNSLDKKSDISEASYVINKVKRTIRAPSNKRYNSEDLYKPRLSFSSSRRRINRSAVID